MDSNIIVKRLIVHILDGAVGTPVLSDLEYNLDSDVNEYIEKHIIRTFKDIDLKEVYFKDEGNSVKKSCLRLKEGKDDFVQVSQNIALIIYGILNQNPHIPSGDLACVLFKKDDLEYIGILKFNYRESYIHSIEEEEKDRVVKIIKQKTALPLSTQKIDECIFINMDDFSMLLKEKKYEIDGEKQFYLSEQVLQSTEALSNREKIDIINKVSKKVVKKYCNDDIMRIAEIKNAIVEGFEDSMTINIEKVGDKAFEGNQEMQRIYTEEIEKGGLKEKSIVVNQNIEKRVMKKQRLVTSDGIEIRLPSSLLSRRDKVEFVANVDGTISIMLKNISEIEDK